MQTKKEKYFCENRTNIQVNNMHRKDKCQKLFIYIIVFPELSFQASITSDSVVVRMDSVKAQCVVVSGRRRDEPITGDYCSPLRRRPVGYFGPCEHCVDSVW